MTRTRGRMACLRHELAHLLFCPVTYFLDPGAEQDLPRWVHPHLFPMGVLWRLCIRYEHKQDMTP